ncbi:MAG: hypothetical protein HUU15_17060 [Candidatus Brocadiae bacterium]|nr:hypothetical protein [Candidatus Brocadiia bacterium]
MMEVRFADPSRATLLAHVFASILRRGMSDPAAAQAVAGLGRIGVQAAGMKITAEFLGDAVVLSVGGDGWRAWVGGDMSDLLGVCLSGAVIGPWLDGRVKWGGNPFALLKLLKILAAARRAGG